MKLSAKSFKKNHNTDPRKEPRMKKRLLLRMILAYILFVIAGFIGTTRLAARNNHPLLDITATLTDIREYFLTSYYMTWLVVSLTGLILLIVYILTIHRPLKQMIRSAAAYAEGEYKKPIPVQQEDELGFLANVMNFMARELDSLEEDQRKFISNISHDFRSPLTSIKGYAEAMADGTIPPELQEKYLNIIVFESERLEKLTQSLLELNKYSAGGMYMDLTVFDINEQIRRTILTFEGRCQEKNLSFDLRLFHDTLYVKADASKIDQVLHNLIDNAVKFSNNNSSITIETTLRNGKVFVSIKDSGIGIPGNSLNKIWERFYKTDLSRGRDKKGTGLGLAIVKEIIHAHHENINVISTEGVGSEFIFSLKPAKQ